MPDIKSELSKVLNQWDKHEETIRNPKENTMQRGHNFKPTNNVSRETFNYVRDNPAQQRKQIVEALTLRGFKSASVDSLLAQMIRSGSVRRDDDKRYFATTNEFAPIKAASKKREQPSAGIAALSTDTAAPARDITKKSIILNHAWTPQKAIENLTVFQARALYDELKNLFGG
jgi:hypothetical protein